MGSCCVKEGDIKKLEDEIALLYKQKKELDERINKSDFTSTKIETTQISD